MKIDKIDIKMIKQMKKAKTKQDQQFQLVKSKKRKTNRDQKSKGNVKINTTESQRIKETTMNKCMPLNWRTQKKKENL